ncbi:MAG: oligopeptide/dipeptide ABC transporter ATP-binding protein [Acidobacteriota bacterium]
MAKDILRVDNLVKHFPIDSSVFSVWDRSHKLRAVDGVNLSIPRGGTLGLVGESGCGKSTTARLITRLIEPTAGQVYFQGQEILSLSTRAFRKIRPRIQMIFQDPYASLNPRLRIRSILGSPLRLHRMVPPEQIQARVVELLEMVGLEPDHGEGYPHQFSGGQRQRISIARALALKPDVIIADEPVSALDVSIRAQILNLLRRLQDSQGISYLFIAHDLSVVRHFCDRVAVMYGGKIVEEAAVEELFNSPLHPYTEVLLSAIPRPQSRFDFQPQFLPGEASSGFHRGQGCVLQERCPLVESRCREGEVAWAEKGAGHGVACHFR